MTAAGIFLDAFHFIRPWVLILVPATLVLWWIVRRGHGRRDLPTDGIAPHLRTALTVGSGARGRMVPVDGVTLALLLATIGAAGPTWSRMPDPFVAQSAPLVIALKVTPSMEDTDVAPSRLDRGKQKIRDLLDLRAGARTALVAYAGSAHRVVPMTEDPGVMTPYLDGLSPDIMPEDGAQAGDALALAADLLSREDTAGGVLFVADSLDPADVAALTAANAPPVAILAMLPDGIRDRGMDAFGGPVIRVTPDTADIRQIDRMLNAAYRRALLENSDQPWLDRGPWLAWPVALLVLLWFRRGWTMRWASIAVMAIGLATPRAAEAGIVDWFLTPDQQGRLAFDRRDYARAADLFADPLWRGYALYRDGQYKEAVQVLDRVETAQAASLQGIAHIKSRSYRDGVRAFQTALQRDPDFPGAAENLATAREIVTYIEDLQAGSDTGEDRGIGADEVALDNESGRGAETQIEAPQEDGTGLLTTDQWMSTVDTRTGDFLRQRFAIDAARRGVPGLATDGEEAGE